MDTRRNALLAGLLKEYGYSHRTLAAEVNKVSGRLSGEAGSVTNRVVRRWVSGAVRWPTSRYRDALTEIFERPPEAMGFVPRGSRRAPAPPDTRRETKEESPVRRRVFLASAAASLALTLKLEETPVRGRLALSDVDRMRQTVGRLDAHFNTAGGGTLHETATVYLSLLSDAVEGCTYGPRVEQALHSTISGLCSSAGWAARDAGRSGRARAHHAAALQSALLADDPHAQARAWSDLAVQARTEGRHQEALRISQAALSSRHVRRTPRIGALLHARLAIGRARTDDKRGAARSMLAAEAAYDRVTDNEPAPPWLRFVDAAEIAGLGAIAHQAMGRLPDAELATAQALRLLTPDMRRNRVYYSVQLAELQAAQGDMSGAQATIGVLDTTAVSNQRIVDRLAAVRRTLAA
ncbi:hypothetical protein [Streptomyces sp. NPDC058595]|uniref:hypothetical protein n=1 Tax=Streptomyces sp. NPDC058595 TaxID=3346550 RepID=UPI003655BAB8